MVNVGPLELILVLIIALIVLGPARLPEVARSVGRGMREFRSALASASGDDEEEDEEEDDEIPDVDDEVAPPAPPADEDEPESPQPPTGAATS